MHKKDEAGTSYPTLRALAILLPLDVASDEARVERRPACLFEVEAAQVASAVPSRRAEYLTARECARDAMASLGLPPVAIPRGSGGAPRWPDAVVGSITHCVGFRGAAAALRADFVALGIDAEPATPLPREIRSAVERPEETRSLARLESATPGVPWSTVLFSVKESIYKAWFPTMQTWLDFQSACVRLDTDGGWEAQVLHAEPGRFSHVSGRWLIDRGVILTALAMRS